MSKTEDEYIEIVITELKGDIFMSMLEWAKKEVEIACKRENPDKKKENSTMVVLATKVH